MSLRRWSKGSVWWVAGPLSLALLAAAVFLLPLEECGECIPGIFVFTDGGSRAGPPVCRRCRGRGRVSLLSSWRHERSAEISY